MFSLFILIRDKLYELCDPFFEATLLGARSMGTEYDSSSYQGESWITDPDKSVPDLDVD